MKFKISKKGKGVLFIVIAAAISIIGISTGTFSHYIISGTAGMFLMFGIIKLSRK